MAAVTITVLRLRGNASLSKTKLYAGNSSDSCTVLVHRMMGSQNPSDMGTIRREDSQKEVIAMGEPSETSRLASSQRLEANSVTGFVDREGCFFIGINPHPEMTSGFQVLPEFTVVQHQRDLQLLHALKKFFGCGVVRRNHAERMCYRVRSVEHLRERIIPFFEKHPLKSKKWVDFLKFRRVVMLMGRGEHLKIDGIERIQAVAVTMNTGRGR